MGKRTAWQKIIAIRQLPQNHNFTLLCRRLAEVSRYADFDTPEFRLLKTLTPGPYTFVLNVSKNIPKNILEKRKTCGFRIPDHPVVLALLDELGEPLSGPLASMG